MNSSYEVDVIVPIYNVELYIEKCINSIATQTYKNIQIILVDDGSTDSSAGICDELQAKLHNIKVIHKSNGGLVSAWMAGIKESSSEWVVFVDGDDCVETNHIFELVKNQTETGADVVVTRMKQVEDNKEEYIDFDIPYGNYTGEKLEKELYPVMINAGGFEKRGVPFSRCSKLIRKSLIISNIQYVYEKATYEEDFNIIAPVLMDAKGVSLINTENSAYCYRRVDSSMLHKYSSKMKDSVYHIYPRLYKACEDKGLMFLKKQIEAEYLSACVRIYTNELRNPNGYDMIRKNLFSLSDDEELRKCLMNRRLIEAYPIRFKLVIYALEHYGTFKERFITKLLRRISMLRN